MLAASRSFPAGYTVTAISHDSQLLHEPRTVQPTIYDAAHGAAPHTVHDQRLLITAAIAVTPLSS